MYLGLPGLEEFEEAVGQHTSLRPVFVHEEDGLRTALLPAAGIGVLIALPGYIINIADIWAQHLPVKPSILQEHLHKILVLHACSDVTA